jgi:hypothetical protein
MTLRHLTLDAMALALMLALALAPLGLYLDDSGFGWFWPGLGGYHFDTTTN